MNNLAHVTEEADAIHVVTRLGEFDADVRHTLTFPQGLPGFERNRRFVLLSSAEVAPFKCLHAVDGPPASFVTVDPTAVVPGYRCVLNLADRARLGAGPETPLVWLAIVAVNDNGAATVNLRAPVVVNAACMVGYQLVPQDSVYPLRYPLLLD